MNETGWIRNTRSIWAFAFVLHALLAGRPAGSQASPPGKHAYGCIPEFGAISGPTYRPTRAASALPASVDLRSKFPVAWDQGSYNACVCNAFAADIEYERQRAGFANIETPARMQAYYDARASQKPSGVARDGGCSVSEMASTLASIGISGQSTWGYTSAHLFAKPSATVYADAAKHRVTSVGWLSNDRDAATNYTTYPLTPLKQALADGHPFVSGLIVWVDLLTDKNHVLVMPPQAVWGKIYDAHAVAIVGYDDARRVFIARNSWGPSWGDHGYFYIPYAYITNPQLAFQLVVVQGVSG